MTAGEQLAKGAAKVPQRRYLIVVPVAYRQLGPGRAAVESAFAMHLRLLLKSLRRHVDVLELFAPQMSERDYEARRAGMEELDAEADGIAFTTAHDANVGRLRFLLGLPAMSLRLWRRVGQALTVHAGPSQFWRPLEILGVVLGWLRRRRTVYVVDIDQRRTPRMNYETGVWSRGVYLRARYFHVKWEGLQTWFAVRLCTAVYLKGRGLVRDYGRGRPNVHYILDAAHSADMVVDDGAYFDRWQRLADVSGGLRSCYFGRLTGYKGVDRMLRAVAAARDGGVPVTLDVYGDGPAAGDLGALVAELGLADSVNFHGSMPYGPEFFSELGRCDLLLATPLSEDTPRSAIDAQALGMPVLAYDTYYYRELADDGAGVAVVPWQDDDALAEQLGALHADRARLQELSRRAVEFARANTQEIWLERRAGQLFGDEATGS